MRHSLHSFTFLIKECGILFVFFYVLYERTPHSFLGLYISIYILKKRSQKNVALRSLRSFMFFAKECCVLLFFAFFYILLCSSEKKRKRMHRSFGSHKSTKTQKKNAENDAFRT